MTKDKAKSRTIDKAVEDLELNTIVHASLTAEQLASIEKIQNVFSEVRTSSLEETITTFKRDQHPDNEITIWLQMAYVYERFTLRRDGEMGYDKKNEAFDLILLRSMMTEKDVLAELDPTFLTADEVRELFSHYTYIPRPLKVDKK